MSRRHHKTPHRHRVKAHTRDGKRIGAYWRGKGNPPRRIGRFRSLTKKDKYEEFNITFDYGKNRKEKVTVMAIDMDDAMNLALENRTSKLKPKNAVIRDGVGEFLGSVAGKVIGGTHVAHAKYKFETEKAKRRAEEIKAMSVAERERKTRKMIYRARQLGDPVAQRWCEKYGVAWERV